MAGPIAAIALSIILHSAIAQLHMKIRTSGVRSSGLTGNPFIIANSQEQYLLGGFDTHGVGAVLWLSSGQAASPSTNTIQ
jgi:hypothetical protein